MKTVADTVAATPGADGWLLTRTRTVELQRYLYADRPEAERTVDNTTLAVEVVRDRGGAQGRSGFTLHGADARPSRAQVAEAVFMASLQSNPPYALPGPALLAAIPLADPAIGDGASGVIAELQERLYAAVAAEPGVRLASAEVFLSRHDTELLTSAGVHYHKSETRLLLDLVVLARAGDRETESHTAVSTRRLADLDVEAVVAREARFARDSLRAELPATGRGPVVLSDGSFQPLFLPFGFATSGEARYQKASPLQVGDALLGTRTVRGDRLTLVSDPTLAWGERSTPFDRDGLALRPVKIVDDGTVAALAASKQYADLLGIRPTGDWSNAVVTAGQTSDAALFDTGDGPLLHIVRFSWLSPDPVRGRFATEIRLGYELGPDGTRPIKGGSLSGNVYDAFAFVHLGREVGLDGGYYGPKALRFGELQVAGA